MGRKQNNKKIKKDQESEEEQEELSQEEVDEDEEDEELQEGDFDEQVEDEFDGDSVLLQKIEERILEVDEEEKLTWAAIYQVKKQQAEINEEMQQEIDTIKEKYEAKRLPLMSKISDAVSGKKLEKSIYADNEFVKSINLNKTKPKALRDYWGKVFESCGLIGNEEDIELLEKLTSFKCDVVDVKLHHIKLTFEFEDNELFGNKIEVEVSGNVADGNFVKKLNYSAKGKVADENSLFGLLTGKDSDDQQVLDTCHDMYRAYVSSTYFYFYNPADDLESDEEGDVEEDGEEEEESEENENGNDVKAVKKQKGSAITEKPECKQQ